MLFSPIHADAAAPILLIIPLTVSVPLPDTAIFTPDTAVQTFLPYLFQPAQLGPSPENRKVLRHLSSKASPISRSRNTGTNQQMLYHISPFDLLVGEQNSVCDGEELFPPAKFLNFLQCALSGGSIGSTCVKPPQIASPSTAQRQCAGKAAFLKFPAGSMDVFPLHKAPHGNLNIPLPLQICCALPI